jgi:hypothetical protein
VRKTIVVVFAALLVAIPAVAFAAKTKTVKSRGTVAANFVEPPKADGSYRLAGIIKDSVSGDGALVAVGKFTQTTAKGTYTDFFKTGTIRGTFDFNVTPSAGGGATISGTIAIKGGTGAFRGANGSGTVTGSSDAQNYNVLDYKQKVSVRR